MTQAAHGEQASEKNRRGGWAAGTTGVAVRMSEVGQWNPIYVATEANASSWISVLSLGFRQHQEVVQRFE